MQIRYGKLGKLLEEKNIDALLVSDGYNMRYFSAQQVRGGPAIGSNPATFLVDHPVVTG